MKFLLSYILFFTLNCHSQNVGIGTQTPLYKLDVNGSTRMQGLKLDSFINRRVIIEGDSYSLLTEWPYQLPDSMPFFAKASIVNYALSGDNVANMRTEYATQAHISRPLKGDDFWFFIYAGINDLAGANRQADTIYNNLKYIWENARTDGYTVVAFTVINSLFLSESKEVQRIKLNNLILGDPSLYDYCIDVASVFDPRIDFSVFNDSTHLNAIGYKRMAGVVANTLGYVPYNLTSSDHISISPHKFVLTFKDAIRFCPMTTIQRDSIIRPEQGEVIYNTDTHKINLYTGNWEQITSN